MSEHVWQQLRNNRWRCSECYAVSNEPHQAWPCPGEPQEMPEDRKAYYLSLLPLIRAAAHAFGYAIGVHGSLVRDFDLIAAPWTESARSGELLAHAIKDVVGGQIRAAYSMVPGDTENKNPGQKPHGRMAWTILLTEGHDAKFIDLSVMPRVDDALPTLLDCRGIIKHQEQLSAIKAAVEQDCSRCDYDEAEGLLISHCDACCRRIVSAIWTMTHPEAGT